MLYFLQVFRTTSQQLALLCVAACLAFYSAGASAQDESTSRPDFVLLLNAGSTLNHDRPSDEIERQENELGAVFMSTYTSDRFRALVEFVLSNEEQELERLQVGWSLNDESMLWFGRLHRPANYWNTVLHHGRYLQTAISRPAQEEWEDDGGYQSSHVTGVMLEMDKSISAGRGLEFAMSAGLGSELEDGLEPFDFLDPEQGHKLALDFRLGYLPDALGENQIGVAASYSELRTESQTMLNADLHKIDQHTVSSYVDWRKDSYRVLASVLYLNNELSYTTFDTRESFVSAYAQLEYEFKNSWIAYGRHEDRWNDSDSRYLELFPDSVSRRTILGMRWDANVPFAITAEYGITNSEEGRYRSFSLQFSAAVR